MPNPNADTRIEYRRGAVHISDMQPEDRLMITHAHSVLEASTEVLNTSGCTLREARFCAVELARALRDMLDFLPDASGDE